MNARKFSPYTESFRKALYSSSRNANGVGFSEGRWNGKAIPIMNELVQMGTGACPYR